MFIECAGGHVVPPPGDNFLAGAVRAQMPQSSCVLQLALHLKNPERQEYQRDFVLLEQCVWRQYILSMKGVEQVHCLIFGTLRLDSVAARAACTRWVQPDI